MNFFIARGKQLHPTPNFFGGNGEDLDLIWRWFGGLTVLADVELAEVDQAGDGGREAGEVVVGDAQLP